VINQKRTQYMEIHEECFASTKKFGRRKTVSKRRAYVNTPSAIIGDLNTIMFTLQDSKDMVNPSPAVEEAIIRIKKLQMKLQQRR